MSALRCSLLDVRPLAAILRAISIDSRATICAYEKGIDFSVDIGQHLLVRALLDAELFQSFELNFNKSDDDTESTASSSCSEDVEDHLLFEINLSTLIQCLDIFGSSGAASFVKSSSLGWSDNHKNPSNNFIDDDNYGPQQRKESNTSLVMSYEGQGYPLVLSLSENGITTRCELATFDPELNLDLAFDNEERNTRCIIKSQWLYDALTEIDQTCPRITFTFIPPESSSGYRNTSSISCPGAALKIEAHGDNGSSEIVFPFDKNIVEVFECSRIVENSYTFSHIRQSLRALSSSTKTSIRMDDQGLISLQFMTPVNPDNPRHKRQGTVFIEFLCESMIFED